MCSDYRASFDIDLEKPWKVPDDCAQSGFVTWGHHVTTVGWDVAQVGSRQHPPHPALEHTLPRSQRETSLFVAVMPQTQPLHRWTSSEMTPDPIFK